jgi:short-subunit dehydrogenase
MSPFPPSEAEKKLAGGVAVITGAGAGIGAGFAKRLAMLGMTVYVAGRTLSTITATADQIKDPDGSAEIIQVDVSKPGELEQLADTVFDKHRSVRLLISNAVIETMDTPGRSPPRSGIRHSTPTLEEPFTASGSLSLK